MRVSSESFPMGGRIPERCAFGRVGDNGETADSENINPELSWGGAPQGTRSFLVACLDDDVPTDREERDARGELPASQLRRRFVHWVQADIPATVNHIPEGALRNKLAPGFGRPGVNDYSRGGKVTPGEVGTGYDGPCPPYFDARWHTYRFMVFALDVETLGLDDVYTWVDAERAMKGHVLASDEIIGIYTLNPRLL